MGKLHLLHLQIKADALCRHQPQTHHFPAMLNLRRCFLSSAASVMIRMGAFDTRFLLLLSFRTASQADPFSAVNGFLCELQLSHPPTFHYRWSKRLSVAPTLTQLRAGFWLSVSSCRGGFHWEVDRVFKWRTFENSDVMSYFV